MWKPPQKIKWSSGAGVPPGPEEVSRSLLFSPLSVGRLNLRARSWVPAMVPWRADKDGNVTPAVLDWYGRFASSRPAAIVVEATGIRDIPSGPLLRISNDSYLSGLAKLVERVKQESEGQTKLFIQIIDFLAVRRRSPREKFLSRFLEISDSHREQLNMPKAAQDEVRAALAVLNGEALEKVLTLREWQSLTMGHREKITDTYLPHIRTLPQELPVLFANAARRAEQAGFDGVELHFAHAYTMASFLSATNTRDDGYGCSKQNRVRLPLEVFKAARNATGKRFVVGARFLADETIEGGSSLSDICYFAVKFANAGMDFLSLSRGGKFDDAKQPKLGNPAYPYTGRSGYECMPHHLSDEVGPFGRNFAATKAIRQAVRQAGFDAPVVAAGGIHNFEMAESVLRSDIADIVGAARQSLADPDWFAKIRDDHSQDVRHCEYSNYCEGLDQAHKPVTCKLWDRTNLDEPGIAKTADGKRRLTAPDWKSARVDAGFRVSQSPQQDRFVFDRLPMQDQWPEILPLDNITQTGLLNCVSLLLDRNLEGNGANRVAVRGKGQTWTYGELNSRVCRIANVLTQYYDVEPGNRVLIYAANSPEVAAIWLAIQKIGAVAVTTLSLLRANELQKLIDISRPVLAISDGAGVGELHQAAGQAEFTCRTLSFQPDGGDLYNLMNKGSDICPTCPTLANDVSIIAFTSGTTGNPKATVHFHRDIISICETVGRHIIDPIQDDVFISTSPLAFTFGLGGLLIFPFYAGACTVLNGHYTPEQYLAAIDHYEASVCFTVPTFYQQLAKHDAALVLSRLRLAVSSGEALPRPVRDQLIGELGINLAEVIGSTEVLHAFAGSLCRNSKPGFIGPAIKGYELAVLDENGVRLPAGKIGRLAVKGPTGCRYFDDPRQSDYVQNGWNITGDACHMDEDGHIAFHTRHDDMIISAGYNISGLEVENALLEHTLVSECAVIGALDNARGQIVEAHIVLVPGATTDDDMIKQLQSHVKATIAPYKYPRSIVFADQLPKTATGKIRRHHLRNSAKGHSQ